MKGYVLLCFAVTDYQDLDISPNIEGMTFIVSRMQNRDADAKGYCVPGDADGMAS